MNESNKAQIFIVEILGLISLPFILVILLVISMAAYNGSYPLLKEYYLPIKYSPL